MEALPGEVVSVQLQRALDGSFFLLVLASPSSAGSEWVNREVDWWVGAERPDDRVIFVQVSGQLPASAPPSAAALVASNPLTVDLRKFCQQGRLSLRDKEFLDKIAGIAARLRGERKEEIVGVHRRQRRRVIQLACVLGVILCVLAAVAGRLAVIAGKENARVVSQSQTITGNKLVAEAENMRGRDPQAAIRLGVAAVAVDDTLKARESLEGYSRLSPEMQADNC
jgi:MTH538 TIR-like domain (DUF1863)